MFYTTTKTSRRFRFLAIVALLALTGNGLVPALSWCADPESDIAERWDEVSARRRGGDFQGAIAILEEIIQEHSDSEDVLRHAYKQLVFTIFQLKDDQLFEAKAREALERFADLSAEGPQFPEAINAAFERLRRQMYGALSIAEPEDGRVFLDGEFAGEIPIQIELLRSGSYDLVVTKSGYHDSSQEIYIAPGGRHTFEISMDKERGNGWWLTRIGAGLVAGTVLAFALGSGDSGSSEPKPLGGPPAPPGR